MVLITRTRLDQESNQVCGEHWAFGRNQNVDRIGRKAMGRLGHRPCVLATNNPFTPPACPPKEAA
jgi:hypothetical protein